MVCSRCGKQILEESNYCNFCGSRQPLVFHSKVLLRSSVNSKIAGVCGGIGEYFGIDPTVVRLIWIVLSVFPGGIIGGAIAYVLAWIVIPKPSAARTVVTEAPLESR